MRSTGLPHTAHIGGPALVALTHALLSANWHGLHLARLSGRLRSIEAPQATQQTPEHGGDANDCRVEVIGEAEMEGAAFMAYLGRSGQ